MLNSHKGLLDLVYQFLEHLVWEKEKTPLARKVHTRKLFLERYICIHLIVLFGHINKIYILKSLQVDTVVNPLKKTVSSVGNMVKSMPDNIVDGVVKVSGGIRNIPSNMLDGMGRMLSNRQVSYLVNLHLKSSKFYYYQLK